MNPGLALSYTKGLSNNIDLMTRIGGSLMKYPIPNKPEPQMTNSISKEMQALI
jgi:hypothetical protein